MRSPNRGTLVCASRVLRPKEIDWNSSVKKDVVPLEVTSRVGTGDVADRTGATEHPMVAFQVHRALLLAPTSLWL
jgi:hypothetical protein